MSLANGAYTGSGYFSRTFPFSVFAKIKHNGDPGNTIFLYSTKQPENNWFAFKLLASSPNLLFSVQMREGGANSPLANASTTPIEGWHTICYVATDINTHQAWIDNNSNGPVTAKGVSTHDAFQIGALQATVSYLMVWRDYILTAEDRAVLNLDVSPRIIAPRYQSLYYSLLRKNNTSPFYTSVIGNQHLTTQSAPGTLGENMSLRGIV